MIELLKKSFIPFILFSILLMGSLRVVGQKNKGWDSLAENYTMQELQELIIPANKWSPYPSVQNPKGFEKIPSDIKKNYINQAEGLLDAKWPRLPATLFLQFARSGNRTNYERPHFKRRRMLAKLVLAEAFEQKGRFTDQIIKGVWAICEESFWGLPAHMNLQPEESGLPNVTHPVVDLFAAETAQQLAWTYYLLKPELDKVDPLIAKRIEYETNRRFFKPYLEHEDWGYMGFQWREHPKNHERPNNWNPWINSNVLSTALVLAGDRSLRLKLIRKTMESIDNFVIPYPHDGSSDEGPSYWGRAAGSLLDYLEILKSASDGKINYFDQPIIKNMGQYIYSMNIGYPYVANYSDSHAKDTQDPFLLYRFGKATNDPKLTHFASFLFWKETEYEVSRSLNRALPALMSFSDIQKTNPDQPLVRDSWFPDTQIMTARSKAGSTQGFYVMAKGGSNGASHNHNDVENFIVYYDGEPVLVDAGSQTYTAKTFSSKRYEIWNNQSQYHNLPNINGVMQHNGIRFSSTSVSRNENDKKATLRLDLASAYPDSANVKSWIRRITLNRFKNVEITEDYSFDRFVKPLAENF